MDIEKLKQKILTKMSENELKSKVKEFMEENGNLLGEEAAIATIARDLGIDMDYEEEEDYGFSIKDIAEGQRNVEIVGKIMDISEVKEFTRKSDNSIGKVRSVIVAIAAFSSIKFPYSPITSFTLDLSSFSDIFVSIFCFNFSISILSPNDYDNYNDMPIL